jgi:predicted nucleotidyltransferase
MTVTPSAPHHPDILESLSRFADHITHCGFDRCYVFGSLINRDGKFFTRSGPLESDVDILITFSLKAAATFETRYLSCCELLPLVAQLEESLHSLLGREDPTQKICSILPITRYELYHNS